MYFFSIKHIFLGIKNKGCDNEYEKLVDATSKPNMFQ